MKRIVSLLLCITLFAAGPAVAEKAGHPGDASEPCRTSGGNRDCVSGPGWCKSEQAACNPEMRGRCGKRKGDWYGARQPVATAAEAQTLLKNYFSGQGYSVANVTEKKWGFRADILDRNGVVADRVMIDKRSGRIRSLD